RRIPSHPVNENHEPDRIIALRHYSSTRELNSATAFECTTSHIERDPMSFLTVEFDFTRRAMSERRRVSIWMICPSQCACPRTVALLMQDPGCSIEFAPAKRVAFGSCDIDDLSARKAIGSNLAITSRAAFRDRKS